MAIDAYTGLPRSGKSYSVVKNVILPSLKQGRAVYTNIPLNQCAFDEFPGLVNQLPSDWFSVPDLAKLFAPGSVVVLDELWRRWPSGLKSSNVPFSDKEFLAEHGHLVDVNGNTTRVVLVTQDLSQIASFARDLVDKTYRSTKLDAVGANSRFRVDIYQGSVTGQRPPKSAHIRSTYDHYEESVWRYYKSSTKSESGTVGDESRADKRTVIWRSPFILFSIFGPILGIPLLLWYLSSVFSADGLVDLPPDQQRPAISNPAPIPQPSYRHFDRSPAPPPPPPPRPSGPTDSPTWRVAGSLLRSSSAASSMPDVVILVSVYGDRRLVPVSDCDLQPDSISYTCTVDGFRAAPWTGRGDSTGWANSDSLVSRTAQTASVATGSGSPAATAVTPSGPTNPPPN